MKKSTLGFLGLSASLLAAGVLLAQTGGEKSTPAPAPAKQQKLVRVCTLNTAQANQEFQANVQLMQSQRQAAIELNTAHEKEVKPSKKKELKQQLDTIVAKLNENNDKMRKTYGFSLDRNYTLVVETAHVYMFVTEEEAAKIQAVEAGKKEAGKK
jgi:hypothetical protein